MNSIRPLPPLVFMLVAMLAAPAFGDTTSCSVVRKSTNKLEVVVTTPVANLNWFIDYYAADGDNRETEFFPDCAPHAGAPGVSACPKTSVKSFGAEMTPFHPLAGYAKARVTVQSGETPITACDVELGNATSLAAMGLPVPTSKPSKDQ